MPCLASRRAFLGQAGVGLSALATGSRLLSISTAPLAAEPRSPTALTTPDANGIRLPVGFTSRLIAVSGMPIRLSPISLGEPPVAPVSRWWSHLRDPRWRLDLCLEQRVTVVRRWRGRGDPFRG